MYVFTYSKNVKSCAEKSFYWLQPSNDILLLCREMHMGNGGGVQKRSLSWEDAEFYTEKPICEFYLLYMTLEAN